MRHLSALGVAFLMMAALVVMPGTAAEAAVDPNADALWDLSVVPGTPNWPDENSVELGVRFITAEDVDITGVRFYKGDLNTGTHFGTLWSATGNLLATGEFTDETSAGWQDLLFDAPVKIVPGQTYVASYWAPDGHYAADNDYFSSQNVTMGPITALQAVDADGNGVFSYSETSTFPSFSFRNTNYWVTPLWTTNAAPSVDAGPDGTGVEGSPVTLSGAVSDLDGDALTIMWTLTTPLASGTCTFSDAAAAITEITCDDDGTIEATLTANDGVNPPVTDTVTVAVANATPSLAINDHAAVAKVGKPFSIGAAVSDPGTNDVLSCDFAWGDGTNDEVAANAGSCSADHDYKSAGFYTITTTVSDDDGAVSSASSEVIVVDPSAGFLTGGGWIKSPAGANRLDPDSEGKASFAISSKYRRYSNTPRGVVVFRTEGLKFRSTSQDWLVVTDGAAVLRGEGRVNRDAGYQFMVWAGDGTPDTLRIMIWTEDSSGTKTVVYDNGSDQEIARGSIKIHTPRGRTRHS